MKKGGKEICTLDDEWNKRINEALCAPLSKLTAMKSIKKIMIQKS